MKIRHGRVTPRPGAWELVGVWGRLHAHVLRLLQQAGQLNPDMAIVDSVLVRDRLAVLQKAWNTLAASRICHRMWLGDTTLAA